MKALIRWLLVVLTLILCAVPVLAFDQVEVSWADFKTFKTRDSFTTLYVSFPQGTTPETYIYVAYGASTAFYFKCQINVAADVTDFETSFKASAAEVFSESEALGKNKIPITKTGSLTTSSVSSLQTVLSYTVPAKQTFHCEQWFVGRINSGTAEMTIAQLQINGTPVDGRSNASLAGSPYFEGRYAHPLPLAVAGDVITVKVTPNGVSSTTFGARLVGELR